MKKKLFRSLIAALAFVPLFAFAHSGAYSTYTWSGTAGSGVALTSEVIDTRDLESLSVVASVATADRAVTVSCLAADRTTALFSFPAVTAAAAGQAQINLFIRPDVSVPGTAPTGVTVWNVSLCPLMQVSMASAAGTAKLELVGRRQQVNAVVSKCGASVRTDPTCYESGSVGAGAALSTGVIDTRRGEGLTFLAEATTTNRALVVSCTDSAGTVLFSFASVTITAGSKFMLHYRPDSPTPGTEATGITHYPVSLCRYMKGTIAAAGAASAKLASYLR